MGYVNEIKTKDGQKYDIQDKRLEKVPVSEVENGVLKVTDIKSSGPTPVATIDGVDYFHKHEFDLEEMPLEENTLYDILTGEIISTMPNIRKTTHGGVSSTGAVILAIRSSFEFSKYFTLYNLGGGPTVDYTSRSFTVVHDQEEVTDSTKICLPENVTAYYGFLSEDGKTFISYWNEEESVPTKVNEVSDGPNTLPIHDKRIIEVTSADVGKVLTVEADGSLAFKEPAAGSKLYLHTIDMSKEDNTLLKIVSTSATVVTNNTGVKTLLQSLSGQVINVFIGTKMSNAQYLVSSIYYVSGPTDEFHLRYYSDGSTHKDYTFNSGTTSVVDTVTEL